MGGSLDDDGGDVSMLVGLLSRGGGVVLMLVGLLSREGGVVLRSVTGSCGLSLGKGLSVVSLAGGVKLNEDCWGGDVGDRLRLDGLELELREVGVTAAIVVGACVSMGAGADLTPLRIWQSLRKCPVS